MNIHVITAVRRSSRSVDVLTMCFEILSKDETFDLKEAICDAAREFVGNTRDGCELWSLNNMDFDWCDFWQHTPNEICEKHGFRKMTEIVEEDDVNWDETLVDESELEITDDQYDAILDHVCSSTETCSHFLDYMHQMNRPEFDDPDTRRDSLDQLMNEDLAAHELLQYYWDVIAPKGEN